MGWDVCETDQRLMRHIAVHALTALCQLGLFERRIMLQLVQKVCRWRAYVHVW